MTLADGVAAWMLVAVLVYVLSGGADFGGGVLDLLASGPRKAAQKQLVERVLAPIWEANHVWLIFFIVLLFSGFPVAFAVATTALHVPLTAFLLGIVARGCAFTFRHYGASTEALKLRYGRVFAIASLISPVFLGLSLGAVSRGAIRADAETGAVASGFFETWLSPFPAACGALTLALFTFLAATYLALEAEQRGGGPELASDFRGRALVGLGVVVALGGLTLVAARFDAPALRGKLLAHEGAWLFVAVFAAAVAASAWSLVARRYRLARPLAAVVVTTMLAGWAVAQRPFLIAPDVTVRGAAAPRQVLGVLLVVATAGTLVVGPSLVLLFRVFRREELAGEVPESAAPRTERPEN